MYLAVIEKVSHGVVVAVAHVSVRPNARLPCGVGWKVKHGVKLYKYINISIRNHYNICTCGVGRTEGEEGVKLHQYINIKPL